MPQNEVVIAVHHPGAAPVFTTLADGGGPFVFTCEHAKNAMHDYIATARDRECITDHWGYDPGAAELTARLAKDLACPAVLSNFSRLLVDPNRILSSETLFRIEAEGHTLSFNAGLDDAEKAARLERFYHPFHNAVAATFDAALKSRPVNGVSMHSFTDNYQGTPREMEIGVLFDGYEAESTRIAEHLREAGFVVALNEPWSGKGGLMYSIQSHSDRVGRPYTEFEIRQDLLRDDAQFERIVAALKAALTETFLPR